MKIARFLPVAFLAVLAACEPQYPQPLPSAAAAVDSLGRPLQQQVQQGGGFLNQHGDALIAGAAGYMMGKSSGVRRDGVTVIQRPVYVAPRPVYRSYSSPSYRPSYRSSYKPSFRSFRAGRR